MKQTITIIGAGISGLVTAKTLLEHGYEVKLFEKENDLGGVWTPTRHYPGMTTQNTRDTYAFSDFPMPKSYPEFPTGVQVFAYLKNYANTFDVTKHIYTNHRIETATYVYDLKSEKHIWEIKGNNDHGAFVAHSDFLIVCNGVFSEPFIPSTPGTEFFIEDGKQILHTSEVKKASDYRNKRVAVIGYGKSACDLAAAIAPHTAQTYIIYREAKWKVPKKIRGVNYKYIILTRFGEALTKHRYRSGIEKCIHFMGLPSLMLGSMQRIFAKQQKLKSAGLRPDKTIKDLLYGELSVESDAFFQQVIDKKIEAVKDQVVLYKKDGIRLATNRFIEVDAVIYGTGFVQKLCFLSEDYQQRFTDEAGNYLLHRNILPVGVPGLAFNGYNSSFFCTLTSEIAALWIAQYLEGNIQLPAEVKMKNQIREHLEWRTDHRKNALFRNATVWPFNLTYVDWLLKDMKAKLPLGKRLSEWLKVVDPGNYKGVKKKIMRRK